MNITELLDRPIAYHRVFVTLTGSVKAAILLSQAMYWQKRAKQSDGWWYKTAEEWQEETGLTRHEQDKARKDCEKYLKTDLRGVPATLYWKVDEDQLSADLFATNGKSSLSESGKLDSRKSSNINRNTETTTENKPLSIENAIAVGQEVTNDMLDNGDDAKLQNFERCLGFGALPWGSNTIWTKFSKWVIAHSGFEADYARWREGDGKYKAFSNKKIRENPAAFIDTGYPEYEASKMYRKPVEMVEYL